jgi:hypothetical protein
MLGEASSHGLVVSAAYVAKYRPYAQDRLYRSESVLYRTLDAARWRAGRGRRSLVDSPATASFALDPSVIVRIQADPKEEKPGKPGTLKHPDLRTDYRPENVFHFLAEKPDLPAYLQSLAVKDPALPADVDERLAKLRSGRTATGGLWSSIRRRFTRR